MARVPRRSFLGKIGTGAAAMGAVHAGRAYAQVIAGAVGGDADAIVEELTANLVSNAHMVTAGNVTVNAQERGYSLVRL